MKKIYNTFLRTTDNVGDAKVSPLDYFEFSVPSEKLCMHEAQGPNPPSDLGESFIIFGGGGLIHSPHPTYADGRFPYLEDFCKISKTMVTWGVGHNVHHGTEVVYPDYFINSFLLHGVRDEQQDVLPWVPCVSCMDEAFDRPYLMTRKYSVVGHDLGSYPSLDGLDKYENRGGNFEECIRFIGSGTYVITNCFHGAYWGLLLGRRVVIFDAYSTRFLSLSKYSVLSSPDVWKSRVQEAQSDPDRFYLQRCREANIIHHEKVVLLVERYLRNEI